MDDFYSRHMEADYSVRIYYFKQRRYKISDKKLLKYIDSLATS